MSYASQAALASDTDFLVRVGAALTSEARARLTEPLGKIIMKNPAYGAQMFMPFLASAPGFADKYDVSGQSSVTDLDILAGIQATWNDVVTVQDVSVL